MPLIAFAIPTGLFFYLDRRPLPGHCPCGYDLRGNVSGTCPECGEPFAGTATALLSATGQPSDGET